MKKQPRTGERWEPHVHNETAIEHLHRYALACELSAGKSVLDLACGEGYGTKILSTKAESVIGIDIDLPTIEKANKRYTAANLRFLHADASKTQLHEHTVDLVVSFETLEHLNEHEEFLKEIKRVLKPGGQLLISTPDKKEYSDLTGHANPFHLKELYREEFQELIARHFKNFRIYQQRSSFCSEIYHPDEQNQVHYSGDQWQFVKNDTQGWKYLVAIASDNELPPLFNSVFNGTSVLQSALEEQANEMRKSLTYRIGHILLWPAKLIRNIFN